MANYGDFRGSLDAIITKLKQISAQTNTASCCVGATSAGVGSSVPIGFKSVSIVKTSSGGTLNITMSDSSVFPMTVQGEVLVHSAPVGKFLPVYVISSPDGATWKWTAVK